ncbi:MAG: cobyric acid synthase [Synergistaceae bacterium]|nr:cobyric acid synthase [Synergistaceae bacterium]
MDKAAVKSDGAVRSAGTPSLMIQGTASDAGKSLIVAGLCRIFSRRGMRVMPFKPQNMSNNAAITTDGGEIGRAQALQAVACGVEPVSDMNPVLLKPETDHGSQVVVQGHVRATMSARDYIQYRYKLMPDVMDSFRRLCAQADIVFVEGAGSIAEVNLRDGDISNMGFAVEAGVPVVLAADIDRGGALAAVIGSHCLLLDSERPLLRGYMMNKFRGDREILTPAIDIIGRHTGLPCAGILRWFEGAAKFPAEDSMALGRATPGDAGGARRIRVYVLGLQRISNFDDFDPLAAEEDVRLSFVKPGDPVPGDGDLIIIPGTKSTIADLQHLRRQGWDADIAAHIHRGGMVVGICGGYQMLGSEISDPDAVENPEPATTRGLGLLDVRTVMSREKTLRRFTADTPDGCRVSGYEIHMGMTEGPERERPMVVLDGIPEGAVREDGLVRGCYIHGLFTSDSYRAKFLAMFRGGEGRGAAKLDYRKSVDMALDDLADQMERELDLELIAEIAGI